MLFMISIYYRAIGTKITLKVRENQHRRKSMLEHLQTGCTVHFQCHGKLAADIGIDQLFQEVSNYCVLESESRRKGWPHVVETKLSPNQIDRFSRFKQVHE